MDTNMQANRIHATECFLDVNNSARAGDSTVADIIRKQVKTCLWSNRQSPAIDTIVIHFISASDYDQRRAFDLDMILKVFCEKSVSSHYLIQRDGSIFILVPESRKAWHCGGSIMPAPDSRQGVNEFSIGIELVATCDSGFTENQYSSLQVLCSDIDIRLNKKCIIVGHDEIAGKHAVDLGLRPDIKSDPGPLFDWRRIRAF